MAWREGFGGVQKGLALEFQQRNGLGFQFQGRTLEKHWLQKKSEAVGLVVRIFAGRQSVVSQSL